MQLYNSVKRVRSSIFVAVVVLVMPALAQNQNQTQQNWSTYEDPILGISIEYPSSWKIEEEPNTVSFKLYENESKPLIFSSVVAMRSLPGIDTNEEFMKSDVNTLRNSISKIYEIDNAATIGGKPASKIVFDVKLGIGKYKDHIIGYYMVYREMLYYIAFHIVIDNYTKYIPTIQKMVDSFKIIE